ncbi:MAG: hypothetical protein ACKVHP_19160 [Verrucomicrobiales bacterium]
MRFASHLLALTLFLSVSLLADDWHEWKSKAGTSIKARLIELKDDAVVLERADGIRLTVNRDQLAPESLALLNKAPEPREPEAKPYQDSAKLPPLEKGAYQGEHATSDQKHFLAVIRRNGQLAIHFKEDGKIIAGLQPIVVQPELHVKGDTGWYKREPVTPQATTEPKESAETVSYTGKTKEGVSLTQHYFIQKDRITAWGSCIDPDNASHPTEFRIHAHIIRSHLLEDNVPFAEIEKHVTGSTWVAETGDGDVKLDFAKRVTLRSLPNLSSDWKGIMLELTPPRPKHGTLQVWNYGEKPLYQGFSASLHKTDSTDDSKSAGLVLRFQ